MIVASTFWFVKCCLLLVLDHSTSVSFLTRNIIKTDTVVLTSFRQHNVMLQAVFLVTTALSDGIVFHQY